MFFQKDYILRMIEMMGDLMRRIRELMNELARLKLLDDTCRKHTGMSLDVAEELTRESLCSLLQPMPRLVMSEILYAKAQTITLAEDEKEALLHKSLHLLSSLWAEGPLCEVRAERLLEMKACVYPLLDSGELLACARFFAEAEYFSDMEDAIFQAAESLPAGELFTEACREGIALLETASRAKPDALALARTSSGELLSSAQELRVLSES